MASTATETQSLVASGLNENAILSHSSEIAAFLVISPQPEFGGAGAVLGLRVPAGGTRPTRDLPGTTLAAILHTHQRPPNRPPESHAQS
jgi:hypothetical protein